MSTKTANTKAPTELVPSVKGLWSLYVSNMPTLVELSSIIIGIQASEAPGIDKFFGSIDSEANAFAIENAKITASREVEFSLRIAGESYQFTGRMSDELFPREMFGTIQSVSLGSPRDDGSWSAQAQGGGEEEDSRAGQAQAAAAR